MGYRLSLKAEEYLVVYMIVEDDILILRVRHAHEDWEPSPVLG